jgi:hypothetical protein
MLMKKRLHTTLLFTLMALAWQPVKTDAQCGPGTTRDTLNWDYLDFLPNSGTYISPIAFITLAQSQTQKFTFGTQRITVTHNYSGAAVGGDVTTHTAETGSFGKGADIRFRGNGDVVFTFRDPVQSLKFSIYDIDFGQTMSVTAVNGITPAPITATTLAGSILSVSGNGTASVTATSSATAIGNNANTPAANATLNIEISGTVTSVTLKATTSGTTTGEDGSYFISDLSACSAGTFPLNYYYISKPYAGQPSYFLAVKDNQIFYVNVANGVARLLFQDAGHTNINSLAYDPYRHMVYYAYSLTNNSQNDRKVKRFDYDMDTMGVFIPDVNTIGIPTYQTGVESGAAGFYDGAYYIGIEGNDQAGATSNRESIIWRIDLDAAYQPAAVAQVWATPVDDGAGTPLHDWSDVGFNDGIMYDFDGASGQTDFYHKDLLTGACVNIKPSPASLVPRQVSVTWAGQMYNSGSPSAVSSGYLAPYNGNGTVNTAMQRTMTYQGVAVAGSWGDAGEAFKPKTDFGDAPASYDPPGIDPGTHERNDSIRLGPSNFGIEWSKHTSADASGDGPEEDGVTGMQIIPYGVNNFFIPVQVYNRTNRNATLAGWIDADGNGLYDPSEGVTLTITPSLAMQTVNLSWTALNVTVSPYSTTFMRLRIATVDEGMTVHKPNGYFDNGEIEDHLVTVSQLLPDHTITLQAEKSNTGNGSLLWYVSNESGNSGYELQRSCNGTNWITINSRSTPGEMTAAYYTFIDSTPCTPTSFYRVKVKKSSGAFAYSAVRKIEFPKKSFIMVTPNPANNTASLNIQSVTRGTARIQMIDYSGRMVMDEKFPIEAGNNDRELVIVRKLNSGSYNIRVQVGDELLTTTLVVIK